MAAARAAQSTRTKAKVAGLIMIIFGAFVAVQAGPAAYMLAQPATWQAQPGGSLEVTVVQDAAAQHGIANATVSFLYPDGTTSKTMTNATGVAKLNATVASFRLQVKSGTTQVERTAVIPPGTALGTVVELQDANVSHIGFDPSTANWLWIPAILGLVVALGGVAAFRMRGSQLAQTGAWSFLAGSTYLLIALMSMGVLIFALTAGLCLWFIRRAQPLMTPGMAFWRRA